MCCIDAGEPSTSSSWERRVGCFSLLQSICFCFCPARGRTSPEGISFVVRRCLGQRAFGQLEIHNTRGCFLLFVGGTSREKPMRLLGISTGEAKRRAAHARVENRAFVATDMEVFAKTNVHFDSRAHSNFFFFGLGVLRSIVRGGSEARIPTPSKTREKPLCLFLSDRRKLPHVRCKAHLSPKIFIPALLYFFPKRMFHKSYSLQCCTPFPQGPRKATPTKFIFSTLLQTTAPASQ